MATATKKARRGPPASRRPSKSAFQARNATGGEDTVKIRVCAGTTCNAFGRAALTAALAEELDKRGLTDKVTVVETGCHGLCQEGPIVVVHPQGVFYPRLKPKDIAEIVETSVVGDGVVERLLYRDPATDEPIANENDIPFYARQKRIVRGINGYIDPTSIDDYLARGGYAALAKVLIRGRPEAVIDEVEALGPARPRRRRVPDRQEVALLPRQPGRQALHHLQRRRGRPRRVHGPRRPRGQPALGHRGHAHRGLRDRRRRGLRLRAPRVPARGRAPAPRARAGARARPAGRRHPRHRLVASTCASTRAPARSSAASPRRSRPRSRATAACRAASTSARSAHGLWGQPTNLNNVETYANVPWIINQRRRRPCAAMGTETSARAPRSSRSPARSGTAASSRCPWARPCARSSSTSAAACCPAASSRPCSSAGHPAAACPPSCSTRRSTSRASQPTAR